MATKRVVLKNKDGDYLLPYTGEMPYGAMLMLAGTAPTGWLLANGQEVSRTTYANLFLAIGTDYGSGNGSTTFNLPKLNDETFIQGGNSGIYTLPMRWYIFAGGAE